MARPALSARRAVDIVNFLAAHPTESFTLSDIVERVGINVASAHAILAVLSEAAYVVRHPRHRTYTLGLGLVAAGSAAFEHHLPFDAARDEMRRVSDELGMEVVLTAPAGGDIVFVARAGQQHAPGVPVHVGQRVPLVPPLGSVFVAWSDDEGVDEWLARAPASTTAKERKRFRAALGAVRQRGYSVALEATARRELGDTLAHLADQPRATQLRHAVAAEIDELVHDEYQLSEIEPARAYEVSMIAAPVFDATGDVVLALTLLGPPPRLSGAQLLSYGDRVRDAATAVTRRTRGVVPRR